MSEMAEIPVTDLDVLRQQLKRREEQVAAIAYLAQDLTEYPNRAIFHADVVTRIYKALGAGRERRL